MPLPVKSNNVTGSKVADNVFIDMATIVDVGILTGTTPKNFREPIDIGFELILKKEGLDFEPKVSIFGRVKRDEKGALVDWGGAFPVRDLLYNIAGFDGEIGDDLVVPDVVLKTLLGQQIAYLRYVYKVDHDGTLKYGTWNQVARTVDELKKKWFASRKRGYPKDFVEGSTRSTTTQEHVF